MKPGLVRYSQQPTIWALGNGGTQLEALARGEVERLVGEIDAANESVTLAQNELAAAQVTKTYEARSKAVLRCSWSCWQLRQRALYSCNVRLNVYCALTGDENQGKT